MYSWYPKILSQNLNSQKTWRRNIAKIHALSFIPQNTTKKHDKKVVYKHSISFSNPNLRQINICPTNPSMSISLKKCPSTFPKTPKPKSSKKREKTRNLPFSSPTATPKKLLTLQRAALSTTSARWKTRPYHLVRPAKMRSCSIIAHYTHRTDRTQRKVRQVIPRVQKSAP